MIRWTVFVLGFSGLLGGIVCLNRQPARLTIIGHAETLLLDGKAKEALAVLEPFLTADAPDGSACYFAGQAALRLKRFAEAAKWFEKVPPEHVRRAESCFRAGDILLLQLHQLSPAEALLREAMKLQPSHPAALGHLAGLYGLCGLTSRSLELRIERLVTGQFAEVDVMLLALGDTAAENAGSLQEYINASPDDPLTLLAQGHQAWQQHDFATARGFYERGLARRPDLHDAQARLGRILCEQPDEAAFLQWHAQLDATAEDQAETWVVRGDWSLSHADQRGGIRCYWEAARRDAAHRRAHYQLGQTLSILGETALAEPFQRRNACLQELLLAAKHTGLDPTVASVLKAVAAAVHCDHPWEAWGWTEVARHRFAESAATIPPIARPRHEKTPRVLATAQPALLIDLSRFSLPTWMQTKGARVSSPSAVARADDAAIRFTDDAARMGLRFEYINGDDLPGPGMRIFQFSGGGVGVLDYDRDGWPDLYLTQGGRWPVNEDQPPADALFRNRGGAVFENIAVEAGINETDYSQGLAVGDIDGDGWADVFVANVAGNRLFRNNGDGTFDDITQSAGVSDTAWSTSAVCADFNGDGLPDLFVVNYLSGPGLLERICRQSNGMPRACTPHEFDAAEDQLLLNLGDGRFQDISSTAGIIAPGGKGLGVVAADFDGTGRLSLFVGNDTTANFFFHNVTPRPGDPPMFEESAIVTGLAFDREGRALACMGIAADDADGDGQLDLFVTNYYNESNTLYLRQPSLLFRDAVAEAGLREPSLKQLGFGAQFLDADLDGWLDLVVTNGHVDDETNRGIPLHMPTQFFHNVGQGRCLEVQAARLGTWFEGKYLGRGLARLDWNRDGRVDFVVSNLDSPAALLTNESPRRGRYLAMQLIGTASAREPIGATVRVTTGDRSLVRQLTAGDGYHASNERRLDFSVETDEQVDVVIHWPSGRTQTFTGVSTESTWVAIESRSSLVRINP